MAVKSDTVKCNPRSLRGMLLSLAVWFIMKMAGDAAVATWIFQPFFGAVRKKRIDIRKCRWITFSTMGDLSDLCPEDPSAPLHLSVDKMFTNLASEARMSEPPQPSRGFTVYRGGKTNGDQNAS